MADLAKGFFFEKKRDNAPEFVKGRVSIKVAEAIEMLKAKQNNAGYVNLDLLQSKDKTKLYFTVNDWQPPTKEESNPTISTPPKNTVSSIPDYPEEEINPDDIPF